MILQRPRLGLGVGIGLGRGLGGVIGRGRNMYPTPEVVLENVHVGVTNQSRNFYLWHGINYVYTHNCTKPVGVAQRVTPSNSI